MAARDGAPTSSVEPNSVATEESSVASEHTILSFQQSSTYCATGKPDFAAYQSLD